MHIKKYFHFTKKTFFIFFGLGLVVLIVWEFIDIYWLGYVRLILSQPNLPYDSQPIIFKQTRSFIQFILSPLFILAIIFLIDVRRRNFSRFIFFILGYFLAYILLISIFIISPFVSEYVQRTQFDSASWKNEKLVRSENPIRIRMADNLLEKHELEGKSRNQINELLGPPDENHYFSEYDYVYWLGPERRLISIDSEWLGIKFKDDIVTEATLLRD